MPEPEVIEPEVVEAEIVDPYMQYIMDLADSIVDKIEKGHLPPKDSNGFYIL